MVTHASSHEDRCVMETLEPRLLLSTESPAPSAFSDSLPTYYAGDYYVADGEQIPLLRRIGAIAVGVRDGEDVEDVLETLTAPEGMFPSWKVTSTFDDQAAVLETRGI